MSIGRGLLFGTLGFLGLLIAAVATVYATKPGNCPPIREDDPSNQIYHVAFLYGGGQEKSVLRAQETARLYKLDYFPRIITLGTQSEVGISENTLTSLGVPSTAIISPVEYSTTTRTNIETGNRTVKERKLGNSIAHISGKEHLRRIKRDNNSLSVELDPSNDGFFPVVNDDFGTPFYRFGLDFTKIKMDSDLTAWYACLTR